MEKLCNFIDVDHIYQACWYNQRHSFRTNNLIIWRVESGLLPPPFPIPPDTEVGLPAPPSSMSSFVAKMQTVFKLHSKASTVTWWKVLSERVLSQLIPTTRGIYQPGEDRCGLHQWQAPGQKQRLCHNQSHRQIRITSWHYSCYLSI